MHEGQGELQDLSKIIAMFVHFINFGLFFILIGKFGFKPMLAALDAREKKISESIQQAETYANGTA